MNRKFLILMVLLCLLVGGVSAEEVAYVTVHDGAILTAPYNLTIDTAWRQDGSSTALVGNAGYSRLTAQTGATDYYIKKELPFYSFNTSNLSDLIGPSGTINSVKFRSSYYNAGTTGLGTWYYTVTGVNASNPWSFVASDLQRVVDVPLTDTNFTDAQYRAGGAANPYNSTLNAAGISFINKTGNTTLTLRPVSDVDNAGTGVVWSSAQTSGLYVMFSEYTGTIGDPVLFVDYTYGAGGDTTPPDAVSNLVNETPTTTSIKWNWDNPTTVDFNRTNIYKNGVFVENLSNTSVTTTFTGLTASTTYSINITTEDLSGNRNTTHWQNLSATTDAIPIIPAFETMVIYADYDGYAYDSNDAPWEEIRVTSGSGIILSPATYNYGGYTVDAATTDIVSYHRRALYTFPSYSLPDAATINSAVASTRCIDRATGTGAFDLSLVAFNPSDKRAFVTSDYARGNPFERLSDDVDGASCTSGAWMTQELNGVGIDQIDAKGNTSVMYTHSADTDADTIGWILSGASGFRIYSVASGSPPFITVNYTRNSEAPVANFTATPAYGRTPLSVTFADTSEHFPESWSWEIQNDTVAWAEFSTDETPVVQVLPNGVYDIRLTVTNTFGSDTETKTDYISSLTSYPNANFTVATREGVIPFSAVFSDTSDAAGSSAWLWDFGDGSTGTTQNPTHSYTSIGVYDVSMTVTNATGSDTMTRPSYISAVTVLPTRGAHPYILFRNITSTPGYINRASSPWSNAETEIRSAAGRGYSAAIPSAYNVQHMAVYYHLCTQLGEASCSKYLSSTTDALLAMNYENMDNPENVRRWDRHQDYENLLYYAVAYDLVASDLSATNNTLIRDNLAFHANDSYEMVNWYAGDYKGIPTTESMWTTQKGSAYPALGIVGEVLYDYDITGKSLSSSPNEWIAMGRDEYFRNDLHNYVSGRTTEGAFDWGMSPSDDASPPPYGTYLGYIGYATSYVPLYQNNIYQPITEEFPSFNDYIMQFVYMKLPNGRSSNYITAGNIVLDYSEPGMDQLDVINRSYVRWSQDLTNTNYDNNIINTSRLLYYGIRNDPLTYFERGNYAAEPINPPSELNWLTNQYATMRTKWSETSDFLSFNGRGINTGWNREMSHADTMGIEYYSHGDLTLLDAGEIKSVGRVHRGDPYMSHNLLLLVDPRNNWTDQSLPYPMVGGWRSGGEFWGSTGNADWNSTGLDTKISTTSLGYTEGTAITTTRIGTYAGISNGPIWGDTITWNRGILAPNNDYFIVVDRAKATLPWEFKNVWRFGSFNITQTTTGYYPDIGNTNGNLSIDGVGYDWLSDVYSNETYTGVTTSDFSWDTVSPYGDGVTTWLFTSPASNISTYKEVTRIGGYSKPHEVFTPHIFMNRLPSTSLYRVTGILSSWKNETARTPSELTVTGTGSAIKIISADGTKTDTIYTGTGNSSLSNGINTDADTMFIRKFGGTPTDYTLINGTHVYNGDNPVFNSTVRLNYISANMSATGVYAVDISGTSGSAILKFYNITSNPSYVTIDGAPASWSRTGTTLTITTALSDHSIEFDGGEGYSSDLPPVASFTPTGTTDSSAPATINFTDTSTNTPDSWLWVFGDGNTTGNTLQNPAHLYTTAGNFSVGLTATNTYGSSASSQVTWINLSSAPIANFTATPVWGEAPLLVTFTDTSTGTPTSWEWEYSNATAAWTAFSTVQNPTITLPQGVYNFRMNATNAYGSNMKTRTGGYVTVTQEFPCGTDYAVYEDHWAKCSGTTHIEMWNVSGTFIAKTGITNVTYYLRGAGAGGNGHIAPGSSQTSGQGGNPGSLATGTKVVTPGTSYTLTLGEPSAGGANGGPYYQCEPGAATGGATTFADKSAAGGAAAYFHLSYWCHYLEPFTFVVGGDSGEPDNYGDGGKGGTCDSYNCYTSTDAAPGKKGYATISYSQSIPVASFTPTGETLATDIDIISFVDTSTNAPNTWEWTYSKLGAGTLLFSQLRNPSILFTAGNYSIELNVSNAYGMDVSNQVTWINVTAAPTDPNPGATLNFQPVLSIANMSTRTITVDMQNVNITDNVSASISFYPERLYIQSVTPNTTTWADSAITKLTIDNSTGKIGVNITRPDGFVSMGLPDNSASFLDITVLYWNYTEPSVVNPWKEFTATNVTLRNATSNLDYPLLFDLPELVMFYQDWTTYSNFSIEGSTSAGIQTLFLPSENNFTANRWTWNFGDGTPVITGNASYPEPHTFSLGGYYNVSSTAYLWLNTSVSNTTYLTANITNDPTFVYADFTASPTAGSAGLLVQFTDTSIFGTPNATSGRTYNWSFGDAGLTVSPTSDLVNPSHVYSTTGTYSVTLTVNNTLGSDTEIKESYITISTSQQNTWYTPKQISVVVMSYNTSTRVVGANVTLVAIGTSLQNTGQLQTIYGVNPVAANEMVNGTLIMSSFTGGDGGTVFTVLGSIRYNAYVTDPVTGILYTVPLNPGLDPYIIWIGTNPLTITPSPQMYMNNTRLYFTQPDAGNVTLALRYQDTSGKTSNVRFIVKAAANMTIIVDENLGNPGTGIVFGNRTYPNILGDSYFWYYNATKVT